MTNKTSLEIQNYINNSIISIIERNEAYETCLNSNNYHLDVTIHNIHLPHYQQIGPTCGLTALLMIKDYYNKLQESELINLINNESKKNRFNNGRSFNNVNNLEKDQRDFSERLNDILNLAIKKNFTNKGEMFWTRGMALLIKNYCGLKCKILKFQNNSYPNNEIPEKIINNTKFKKNLNNINNNIELKTNNYNNGVNKNFNSSTFEHANNNEKNFHDISLTILKNLLKDNLCLISYDKDGNNEPCFKKGHKAHWCIINGFIIIEPVENEVCSDNIPDISKNSKFNIIWNNKEASSRAIFHLEKYISNLYFICTHSSSKYPGIFNAENLLKSNAQLNEVAPAVINETKESLFHKFHNNNNIKNQIRNNHNLQMINNVSPPFATSTISSSVPTPPPPMIIKNENNFTNESSISFISKSIHFSDITNKNNNLLKLNSCQKTQINRRGYIIPNFYSFPKKNIYNWEQYKVDLRKNITFDKKSKNNNMNLNSSDTSISYRGHSIKETLSSSIILVGKDNSFINNI
ncbi:hypothetical protein BCR32DRAFT_291973 [Anaeromyces robustus]|uniref:Actin maturation protease n=1 Tax=Anaeromyces robustus TaxID=1754192 RepID=A0A1Y1XCN9_9FUNG|nr:hypothetical protein BCR32DRAFT_291973 [Anaeromyces robustus]|eukprot:ORX83485.1 hypothetical protein BCR32DRAFT_291973 [Anaeromyces robustus]